MGASQPRRARAGSSTARGGERRGRGSAAHLTAARPIARGGVVLVDSSRVETRAASRPRAENAAKTRAAMVKTPSPVGTTIESGYFFFPRLSPSRNPGRAHAVDRYRRDVSRRRGNSRVKDPWKKKARKSPLVTSPRVAPPHSETRRLAYPRASPPRSPQGSQPTRFSRLVASLDAFAVVRSSRSGVRRLALPRKGASRSFTLARPAGLFRRAPGCQRARFKRSGEDGVHRKYCRRARRHVSVR